jgi:hypothetical protein
MMSQTLSSSAVWPRLSRDISNRNDLILGKETKTDARKLMSSPEQRILAWKLRVARQRSWRKATTDTSSGVLLSLRLHYEAGPTSLRTKIRKRL